LNPKIRTSACKEKDKDETLSLTNEKRDEEEKRLKIIDRSAVVGRGDRKWSDWLKDPAFYKVRYALERYFVSLTVG
jgi:hypothetical protein